MLSYKYFLGSILIFTSLNAFDYKIRLAEQSDMEWVNNSYDTINFIHSDWNNEIIGIAEVNGKKVGVGRLVKVEEKIYELGGMYVYEEYRQHKIATKIIELLLNQVTNDNIIYCLPFKPLTEFYKKFGFKEHTSINDLPKKIAHKLNWCNQTYEYEVGCLVKSTVKVLK